jgi:RNA polymerase sigma factor (sigma-70 family)
MAVMGIREERFNGLWREHHQAVAKFVLRRLPEREDASDVVADVFVTAWRRLDELTGDTAHARPWLYGVAHKTIANRLRGSRRRSALETRLCLERDVASRGNPLDENGAEPSPEAIPLIKAFNRLSTADREAIALVTWEELTPGEAAKVIGVTPARFRVRLHRARKRLRDRAGEREPNSRTPEPEPSLPLSSTTEEVR